MSPRSRTIPPVSPVQDHTPRGAESSIPSPDQVIVVGLATFPSAAWFHVNVSDPAVLVVSQQYYTGWKAYVEASEVEVHGADCALVGIPVSAGDQFRMEPNTLKWGFWDDFLSGASGYCSCFHLAVRQPPSQSFFASTTVHARIENSRPHPSGIPAAFGDHRCGVVHRLRPR